MLRHQIFNFRLFLQPKVLYSTAVIPNKKKPQTLIKKLSAEFEDISPIMKDLENKELININFEEWKNRISELKMFHFTDIECFRMISKYPCLLKIPLEKFKNSTQLWFSSDIGLNNFHLLLLNQPQLLEVEEEIIRKRVPLLRSLFRTSDALVLLLINSPNVMYDDWKDILHKINYLTKVKRFKMGDVVHSFALSKSIYFIKFRLDLLEKCGIYKQDNTPLHKVNLYDKSRHINPSLKNMFHIHFNDFIKIAKISEEEYAVYKDLFMENENENENENDDDDDDDGSD